MWAQLSLVIVLVLIQSSSMKSVISQIPIRLLDQNSSGISVTFEISPTSLMRAVIHSGLARLSALVQVMRSLFQAQLGTERPRLLRS